MPVAARAELSGENLDAIARILTTPPPKRGTRPRSDGSNHGGGPIEGPVPRPLTFEDVRRGLETLNCDCTPETATQTCRPGRGCACYENEDAGNVPLLEKRSYVPASHGTGFRYNWDFSQADPAQLLTEVEDRKERGYRVAYLNVPGTATPGYEPLYNVSWVRDDDSSFHTGVAYESPEGLQALLDELREHEARPICISFSGTFIDDGFYAVVWIQDRKYREGEWQVRNFDMLNDDPSIEDWKLAGYRMISATICVPSFTAILVRDFPWEEAPWMVWTTMQGKQGEDPIAKFQAWGGPNAHRMVPLVIEGKSYRGWKHEWKDGSAAAWVIIAVYDADLDTWESGEAHWEYDLDTNPWDLDDLGVIGLQRRIQCIASVNEEVFRTVTVIADAPQPACRVIYERPASSDIPFSDIARAQLTVTAFQYMQARRIPALSLTIADDTGTRFSAGFTLAPWSYPDTYPASGFRIGSVAKAITAVATWTALEANPPTLASRKVFEIIPDKWRPIAGDGVTGYPEGVYDVEIGHLLSHQGGWSQLDFHPGSAKRQATMIAQVSPSVASAPIMAGWSSESGEGLRPLVRDDYMLYMLRREAWAGLTDDMRDRVGWSLGAGGPPVPADPGNRYDGFGYDLLGVVIESLIGNVSAPRHEFDGYVQWVDESILSPLGMTKTFPARTARLWALPHEVVYRSSNYLEEDNPVSATTSNPTRETLLFEPSLVGTGTFDPFDAYVGDVPLDIVTPRYATQAYCTYPLEPGIPRAGWVSTAPDLARFLNAHLVPGFNLGNAVLSSLTYLRMKVMPVDSTYDLGGLHDATGGYVGKTGCITAEAQAGAVLDPIMTRRRIAFCRLYGQESACDDIGDFHIPVIKTIAYLEDQGLL